MSNKKLDEVWNRIRRSDTGFLHRGSNSLFSLSRKNTSNGSILKVQSLRDKSANEGNKDNGNGGNTDNQAEQIEPLYDLLYKDFIRDMPDKKYGDIIRIGHILTVHRTIPKQKTRVYDPSTSVTENEFAEKVEREMVRMIFFLRQLVKFFTRNDDKDVTVQMVDFLFNFHDSYKNETLPKKNFNLGFLLQQMQENFTSKETLFCVIKIKKVLKMLTVSIVVRAIEEYRKRLKLGTEYLTRDIHGRRGWNILVKLDDKFVEIRHVRREACLKQNGENNYWELEYNMTMSFDPDLKELTAVRLAITDLELSEGMDPILAEELKAKFFNGRFIIC